METRRRHLPFLVIGGHAVALYGFPRETADLDFFVCSEDRPSWATLFADLGYHIFSDAPNFAQLASHKETAWPVDLMFVRPATFKPMLDASRVVEFYGTTSRIPALEHLIALKLHAIKNTQPNRFLKDFLDVENLIRANRVDIKSENIRRLFEKYATRSCMRKCRPRSTQENEIALELPTAPDFVSQPPRIDPQAMLERIAQAMPLRNKRPGEAARRAAEKIPVEFVL